jgi:predicted MFS family arabinose efflux permease
MNLTGYRRFLGHPGVPRLFGAMLVGRLPAGMLSLAIVLRITGDGGSYRLAGGITAAFTLGIGVTFPVLSRLVDRRGQTVVLIPCAFATLASATLLAVLPADSPPLLLMTAGALLGGSLPPLSSASRTMWPAVLVDPAAVDAAYAADATFQELIFIVGPLLVVVVAAAIGTAAAILTAGILACAGTLVFATSRISRSWRAPAHSGDRNKALRSPGIRVLVVTMFALIGGFAAEEVSLIAVAKQSGSSTASGVLLSVWSLSSLVAGFLYGMRSWPGLPAVRVMALLAVTSLVTLALAPQRNLIVVAAILAVSGLGGAPALSAIYRTAQQVALPGVVTESYAWLGVGTLVGSAAGAAIAGQLITTRGPADGFLFASAAIVLAAIVIGVGRRALAEPAAEPTPRSVVAARG